MNKDDTSEFMGWQTCVSPTTKRVRSIGFLEVRGAAGGGRRHRKQGGEHAFARRTNTGVRSTNQKRVGWFRVTLRMNACMHDEKTARRQAPCLVSPRSWA